MRACDGAISSPRATWRVVLTGRVLSAGKLVNRKDESNCGLINAAQSVDASLRSAT
jgi:hypothetical protein